MLTRNHIDLYKYIMNNPTQELKNLSNQFNKTQHMLRKDISTLNAYLPNHLKISISLSNITTLTTYTYFTDFVSSLSFKEYQPSISERLSVIIVYCYFEKIFNLTQLYNYWGISLNTKKRDVKSLEQYLEKYKLSIKRYPGQGISIEGNNLRHRILVVQILNSCTDVYDFNLKSRSANTPIENQIYQTMIEYVGNYKNDSEKKVKQFLFDYQLQINYYSKKFFILYILLSNSKTGKTLFIESLVLEPLNLYLFENNRLENRAFNQVASMLDFYPVIPIPFNMELDNKIKELFVKVTNALKVKIITKEDVLDELYAFIYRNYFYNYFNYIYDDRLVKTTKDEFKETYQVVSNSLNNLEDYLLMKFNDEQKSSLTLIFTKWITKNQIFTTNKKKIVVVSNVSFERIRFFIEQLSNVVDFEFVRTVDINEIELLNSIEHDILITFSNRISTVLEKNGFKPIKLNFFISNDDILSLLDLGLTTASRRLIASDIASELEQLSKEEITNNLKRLYPEIFI